MEWIGLRQLKLKVSPRDLDLGPIGPWRFKSIFVNNPSQPQVVDLESFKRLATVRRFGLVQLIEWGNGVSL